METARTENDAIIEHALATADMIVATPKETGIPNLWLVRHTGPDGRQEVREIDLDGYAETPRFHKYHLDVRTARDFIQAVERHATTKDAEIITYLHTDTPPVAQARLTAGSSINPGNPHGGAITLYAYTTKEWDSWINKSDMWLTQEDMADFLDRNRAAITNPTAADMLEIVQSMTATVKAEFASANRLANGATVLQWREDIEAKAGKAGQLVIPETITLALQPLETLDTRFKIGARFRFKIADKQLRMMFILADTAPIMRAARLAFVEDLKTMRSEWTVYGLDAE